MKPIEVVHLGSCILNAPISALLDDGKVRWALEGGGFERSAEIAKWSPERGGYRRSPAIYCIDEAIQLLRFLRGEVDVPQPLRPLCDLEPTWEWMPAWREGLRRTEVVLLEITSPVRVALGPVVLNHIELNVQIGDVLSTSKPELRPTYRAWYYQGLMGGNEAVRTETGNLLAAAVTEGMPQAEQMRTVLREARPYHRSVAEIEQGVQTVRALMDRPLGIVTHTRAYMPDGRPVPWPADFLEQTVAVAEHLGLPAFEPRNIVRSYGAQHALEDDFCHYQVAFWPVLGNELLAFMQRVLDTVSAEPKTESPAAVTL